MFGIALRCCILISPHSNPMRLANEGTEAGKGQVTSPRLLTLPMSAMIPGTEGVLGCGSTPTQLSQHCAV